MVAKGIEIADLGNRIDDKVDTYSKGMKRRLLVGRALMIDPKLAILDEPTSGLDVINAQEIRKIIKPINIFLFISFNNFTSFIHFSISYKNKVVKRNFSH